METVNYSLLVISLCVLLWGVAGQYEWQIRDAFDEVRGKMDKINPDNCIISHQDDLYLPEDSVSHHPDVKEININPVFPNRTALLHLHNMAMNRAFFWSYILQSRFIRPAINDTYDPGMMYYFLSSVADVSSNPYINASSIYFSPNMSYTSSYRGFFNKTMPRFAPRAYRADDFNDPVHLQKISTLNTFHVEDLGAFDAESLSKDYTSEFYRINEWYKRWLPDRVSNRHDTKTTYQVEIRYANNTNETFTFHGPPGNDEVPGPVNWTRPYFDCGRLNKWLVAAVSPIADIFPRHTQFRHIEYPTYTAAVVMELDYDRIDINQCPPSQGNDRPNRFASTARCKETTECEPLHGWGFRRGGYQCRCAPGSRLPSIVRRPYLGEIIERASSDQYYNNFDCKKIGWVQRLPVQWEKAHPFLRAIYRDRYFEYVNSTSGPGALHTERMNVFEALNFIRGVQPHNCSKYAPTDLFLNGDIAYGAEEQLENQAKMALRLANFISAFLQVSDPLEVFSGNRVADKHLTEDQMFGETLAVVLGDSKIWSAGTFWDRNKFTNRTFFAPFAYKKELNTRKFKLEDLARLNKTEEVYTGKPWFQFLKQRWSTNFDSLEQFFLKMKIRNDEMGKYLKRYERFPTYYRAANLKHGHWTRPYYDCDGHLKQWVITYAAPFFGWDSVKVKLEFKGVVAVTMSLMSLDINQCPDKYYVPNAFKSTDKCDRSSSYCVPILGRGFEAGGYKCECLQGYEYPFEDPITYYDGQIVEAEFQNIIADKETRIDMFKCRLAGAGAVQSSADNGATQDELLTDVPPIDVLASEESVNESTTPLTSAQIEQSCEPPELKPELLLSLGEADELPIFGENIYQGLAEQWLPILKEGLPKEIKDKLLKDYAVPENCKLLKAPNLNPEISATIAEDVRNRDKNIRINQDQLGHGLSAISKAITMLLLGDDELKAIEVLSDAGKILTDLHYTESQVRTKLLTQFLEKSFLTTTQRDETPLGNDLAETIKASKTIEEQSNEIKTTSTTLRNPTQASTTPRSRYQGNWTTPYSSNTGAAGRGAATTSTPHRQSSTPPAPPTTA